MPPDTGKNLAKILNASLKAVCVGYPWPTGLEEIQIYSKALLDLSYRVVAWHHDLQGSYVRDYCDTGLEIGWQLLRKSHKTCPDPSSHLPTERKL